MSNSSQKPWSDNPGVSRTPYLTEKAVYAGILIGAMCYGTLIDVSVYPCSSDLFDLQF